ncbi:MAG: prephenate dehydrogenase [Phycisphaeraceae bacterium]
MSVVSKPLVSVAQVTIAGVGLLGGSVGLALRAAGYEGRIVGVGRRREVLEVAKSRGCIDAIAGDIAEAVAMQKEHELDHLIVLCTPLSTFASLFEAIAEVDHDNLFITDAGSTKAQVCADAKRLLPDPTRFVGAHPMAGSELHGPQHAKGDLFKGRLCILTPQGTECEHEAIGIVNDFWLTLGMKLTVKTPEDHDRLVAAISHLPHAAAVLLVKLADELTAISIAATGFKDTTRIASGDPRVWTDIFTSNRSAMLESIDQFTAELAKFRKVIDGGDESALTQLLEEAKHARDTWLKATWGE